MQAYPQWASVTAGQVLTLCVQPNVPLFQVAFFQQGTTSALTPLTPLPVIQGMRWATRSGAVFTTTDVATQEAPDIDWQWPQISFALPGAWGTGVYFAAVYEVDAAGSPTDALGKAIAAGSIYPCPSETQGNEGLALFVVRPAVPTNPVAYVLALSTYHAYNYTGGGCFYYANEYYTLTLRRPGGGVCSPIRDEESDPYDPTSKRNTFAHYDAPAIAWLANEGIACDFYTNMDLDEGSCLLNAAGTAPAYQLMLSVGHDEYWSSAIRENLQQFLTLGGNVAIFSGNTCFRPVAFTPAGAADAAVSRLAASWSASDNECTLIGVSYSKGAGRWFSSVGGRWYATRWAVGYTVQLPDHWVFQGTGLEVDQVFGQGTDDQTGDQGDHLVGYETDGIVQPIGSPGCTPEGFEILALGICANQRNPKYDWNDLFGSGAMVIDEPASGGVLFNAATTDWVRLLTTTTTPTPAGTTIVTQITRNVLTKLAPG